jgi:hypothetical protein
MVVGAATLPETPIPSDGIQDDLAKGTLERGEAARWNRIIRLPSRLLVWGIFPVAAIVMGAVAGMFERRRGVYLAPLSFTVVWVAIVWGSWPDKNDVSFGLPYTGVAALGAVLVSAWARSRKLPRFGWEARDVS